VAFPSLNCEIELLESYGTHQMPQQVLYETFHNNGHLSGFGAAICFSSIHRFCTEPQSGS
jgi:hypothetical protein